MTKGLDQFYTNEDIAEKYYSLLREKVDINEYNYLLEPSAGSGSFYNLLDTSKRIGLDLDPKVPGLIQTDFLKWEPEKDKKYLVLGNPPFGRVSSLAIKFFNKSAEFADCIAFIIPRTFKRTSVQNKLSLDFKLVYSEDLPMKPCCFTPNMDAKCCFQIWKRTETKRQPVEYQKTHPDFTFIKHGPKDDSGQPTPPDGADFVVHAYGSNCGDIKDSDLQVLRPKSWHWIKSNIDPEVLKGRLRQLDYSMSEDTVRQNSMGQKELIFLYSEFLK